MNIAIIGKGNLGTHLYGALKPMASVQWYARDYPTSIDADLVIVSVSDKETTEVCERINANLVVHTAGIVPQVDTGNAGVLYPLYSFTKGATVDWANVPFLIETAQENNLSILKETVTLLGAKFYSMSSAQRTKIHAAAVIVNNFTNHLYTLAEDYCQDHKLPFEVLHGIMQQGPSKAIELGAKQAQTGPAIRGDYDTIENHLEFIRQKEIKGLYEHLSASIRNRHEL